MSTPVSGSAEESNTVSWRDPIGASSLTTAVNGAGVFVGTPGVPAPGVHVRVGVPVGTSVPAVGGVVGGRVGVRVAVGTVGRGVVGPGVGRVAVGLVGRGVAVATGVDCAPVQVPDGQSALPVHVYPANWPPTQTFPVDRHCEPGHWSLAKTGVSLVLPSDTDLLATGARAVARTVERGITGQSGERPAAASLRLCRTASAGAVAGQTIIRTTIADALHSHAHATGAISRCVARRAILRTGRAQEFSRRLCRCVREEPHVQHHTA